MGGRNLSGLNDESLSFQSGCEIWEQLMDQNSGRLYYYNRVSGATSWNAPMPAPHAAPTMTDEPAKPDDGPVPDHWRTLMLTGYIPHFLLFACVCVCVD